MFRFFFLNNIDSLLLANITVPDGDKVQCIVAFVDNVTPVYPKIVAN